MEHNCNFNKIALLTQLRSLKWRLETYRKDAEAANHPFCNELMHELEADIDKFSKKLQDAVVGLAKEDKFTFCESC